MLYPSKKGKWEKDDDQHLIELVNKHGKNWILFSKMFNRLYHTILFRYNYITNPQKPWTFEENIKLNEAIINYGENWLEILKLFPYCELKDIKSHYRTNPKLNPFVNIGRLRLPV